MTVSPRNARKSREEIVRAIVDAGEQGGLRPGSPGPSLERFEAATGIKDAHWKNVYWTRWSDALVEAGYKPNPWGAPRKSDEQLLIKLAALTRDLGKIPTANEVRFAYNNKTDFPASTTFTRKFGRHRNVLSRLRAWVAGKGDWADVAEILGTADDSEHSGTRDSPPAEPVEVSLSDSFLPPILACLSDLGEGDERILQELNLEHRSAEKEFERRVAVAFRLLGLRVLEYGQGTGRRADGIAVCAQKHWAVVFDAKLRRELYKLGALEDRKFKEYIAHHGDELERMGTKRQYFAIISSSFRDKDVRRAKEIARQSCAKSCALVEAGALAKLVERKLEYPDEVGLDEIERVFAESRIISSGELP
jgi:hypothetical protein